MNFRKLPNKDYGFVALQITIFAAYALPVNIFETQWPAWIIYTGIGLIIFAAGLGLLAVSQLHTKLSPFPTPVDSAVLRTRGAYGFSRHPIYSALLIGGVGYACYDHSFYKLGIVLLLYGIFYAKAKYEEQLLTKRFENYKEYQKKVGRFFPKRLIL